MLEIGGRIPDLSIHLEWLSFYQTVWSVSYNLLRVAIGQFLGTTLAQVFV